MLGRTAGACGRFGGRGRGHENCPAAASASSVRVEAAVIAEVMQEINASIAFDKAFEPDIRFR